jgi:hypothetical protein
MGVKFTSHLHLVPRSRKVELYLHCPICLHGIVLKSDKFTFTFSLSKTVPRTELNMVTYNNHIHPHSLPFACISFLFS